MNCTIRVAKTKGLTTANVICAFVFAYADCWFCHEVAHLSISRSIRAQHCVSDLTNVTNRKGVLLKR